MDSPKACSDWPSFCTYPVEQGLQDARNQRAQQLCGLHCFNLPFRDLGSGWVDGKCWDPAPEKTGPAQQGRHLWLMWGQQPTQVLLFSCSSASALHRLQGLLTSSPSLSMVKAVAAWRWTDFAGLGLFTECTVSKSQLERVTLPCLSCTLGWWRAFPHAATGSQLQVLWNALKIPSLVCPASVSQQLFWRI